MTRLSRVFVSTMLLGWLALAAFYPGIQTALSSPDAPTPLPSNRGESALLDDWITFQQGLNGYTGARDVTISSWEPDKNRQSDTADQQTLIVRADDAFASLLRFDLSSLPTVVLIGQAKLRLYAIDWHPPLPEEEEQPLRIEIYEVLRPWVDAEATWSRPLAGEIWGEAGCNSPSVDRAAIAPIRYQVSYVGQSFDIDLHDLVQQWVRHPESNYGIILKAFAGTKGVMLAASDHPVAEWRPQLVMFYAFVTPTPTSRFSPTSPPTATQPPGPTWTFSPTFRYPYPPPPTPTITPTLPPMPWRYACPLMSKAPGYPPW